MTKPTDDEINEALRDAPIGGRRLASMVAEIRRLRAMERRLEELCKQLDEGNHPTKGTKFDIAVEIRNRMKGPQ